MSTKPARKPRISVRYARLFAAIENMIAGFEPAAGLEPFRIPSEPKPLDPLIFAFFGDGVDPMEVWNELPFDFLELIVGCGFGGGPGGSSSASIRMLTLPSRRHVYIESAEYSGVRVLAATGPLFTTDDMLRFLELLCADNGARFGIGVIGSAPEEFATGVEAPREKLIDLFYNLFTAADAFESLRSDTDWQLGVPRPPRPPIPDWVTKLSEKFGPVRGPLRAKRFAALCEAYRKKHKLPVIEQPDDSDDDDDREYSNREVVEFWLQSHDVITART